MQRFDQKDTVLYLTKTFVVETSYNYNLLLSLILLREMLNITSDMEEHTGALKTLTIITNKAIHPLLSTIVIVSTFSGTFNVDHSLYHP